MQEIEKVQLVNSLYITKECHFWWSWVQK